MSRTTLALAVQHWVAPDAGDSAQTAAVVAVANVLSTVLASSRCVAGSSPVEQVVARAPGPRTREVLERSNPTTPGQ